MNANFKHALEAGNIEPVILSNNKQFEIDGIRYYRPSSSGSKMAINRFHSALDIIRMHEELRISYEVNKSGWDQVKELSTRIATSTDLEYIQSAALDLIVLQKRIDARMEFGRDIEQVYQLTAIYFLTEDEDPAEVTQSIIKRKVESFKSQPSLYNFFLSLPLNDMLDLSKVSDTATLNYLKEINLTELIDLKIFLTKSKIYGHESDTIKSITSQMETLSASQALINSLLSNTSTRSQGS